MSERFILAAQLSTGHSRPEALSTTQVLPQLQAALGVAPLDILILGWEELPELFGVLTGQASRPVDQVFLWYPLLSDYPGMQTEHLMLDHSGARSQGWGDFVAGGEINETFRFACPNNPAARQTTLYHLERLLTTYNFDGVFLDKFRFPSPANGLAEMFSCFCPYCFEAAGRVGLDLAKVKQIIQQPIQPERPLGDPYSLAGANWLQNWMVDQPSLREFLRFRSHTITELVASVRQLAQRLGKQLALDVFSPGLATLVGQDYAAIAPYGVWAKPMIYRFAKGPAGFALELPTLEAGLEQWSTAGLQQDVELMLANEGEISLELIVEETRRAVEQMAPAAVYLGVETVSMPGVIEVTPGQVKEAVGAAKMAGAAGVVLSWDLLHTPLENLRPLARKP